MTMDEARDRQHHILALSDQYPQQTIVTQPSQRKKRSTACKACKKRRSKCLGNQPCVRCVEAGTECLFDQNLDRRRKFILRNAVEELGASEQLLDNVAQAFSLGENAQVQHLLSSRLKGLTVQNLSGVDVGNNQESVDGIRPRMPPDIRNYGQEEHNTLQEYGSTVPSSSRTHASASSSSSSVGSLDEVATVSEDINRSLQSRSVGYIGKNSELAWMHRLDDESLNPERRNRSKHGKRLPLRNSITDQSYFMGERHDSEVEEADPYILPTRSWGNHLMETYLQRVDPSFPLIERALFASQYKHAFTQYSSTPPRKWLAVLNMLFAIGAKYLELSQSGLNSDLDDHIFFHRAMTLSANESIHCEHADIQQVQIELLASIYYLASAQINRSWKMVGIAARSAIGLGINQRPIGDVIDPVSKETRCRIWWSIVTLEHQLSVITGRASCLDYHSSGVGPPSPVPPYSNPNNLHRNGEAYGKLVEKTNDGKPLYWTLHGTRTQVQHRQEWFGTIKPTEFLYFFHLVDLEVIAHAVINNIYNADVYRDGWDVTAARMTTYQVKFDTWLHGLRKPFDFMDADGMFQAKGLSHDQISLALNYFSSQIILNRPCLSHSKEDEAGRVQLPRSKHRRDGVLSCKLAALAVISILPDKPDMDWLYRMTPWLNILHFIMQALAVLLVHVTVEDCWEKATVSSKSSEDGKAKPLDLTMIEVFTGIKKAMNWLVGKADKDLSAQRAFNVCNKIIHQFDPTNSRGLTDIPSTPRRKMNGETSANLLSQPSVSTDQRPGPGWGPDREVRESGWEQEPPCLALDPMLLNTSYLDLNMM